MGKPVLSPGASDSNDAWTGFLVDMKGRCLRDAFADRLRRGVGDHLCLRAGARSEPAPEVCHPPRQEHPRQGAQARQVRGEGRLLVDLRRHRAGASPPGGARCTRPLSSVASVASSA
jgi:hypothetical protein